VLFSLTGNWVEAAAFGYVVLLLGGSAATLGLIGFLNTIPNLLFGLPAGALADRYDRRRLILVFQGLNMLVAVALAVLWQLGALTVPLMGAIAVVGGSLGTLSFPAVRRGAAVRRADHGGPCVRGDGPPPRGALGRLRGAAVVVPGRDSAGGGRGRGPTRPRVGARVGRSVGTRRSDDGDRAHTGTW
jgi:hypothetical protein